MSDIIHVLSDAVANQIAAGEVIQRPASVIKELVENSIDAGATQIDIVVVDAGRTCIQVIDNGKGMSATDARLSFERHATSKIRQATDLFNLHTMGFRGEALASIAAVAEVELHTRMESDELGTSLCIKGSKVEKQEPTACAKGCNIAVRNLFFNVPARRKFLKTDQTELNNILAETERIVLVHPEVGFSLQHNGVDLLNLRKEPIRQRIVSTFGKKINDILLPVEIDTSMARISGFVGRPDSSHKKGLRQFFFTNKRFMRHPYFHKAIIEAYEHLIPAGEQVSYFLYFEVNPADIDVNIHPTKTEIKFENERGIWQILNAAVRESLGKFNETPCIDFDNEGKPDIPAYTGGHTSVHYNPPPTGYNPSYNPFSETPSSRVSSKGWEQLYQGVEQPIDILPNSGTTDFPPLDDGLFADEKPTVSTEHFQYNGRYIVSATATGLMLIDQHRAHIRILFDRYMAQLSARGSLSQRVLFPEIVQFPASDLPILQSISEDLAFLGFELSDLGGGSFAVNGVPADIAGLNPITLLQDMVHTTSENGCKAKEDFHFTLALSLARAAALPYGQILDNEEMHQLATDLLASTTPNKTPTGQLTYTIINDDELNKVFA